MSIYEARSKRALNGTIRTRNVARATPLSARPGASAAASNDARWWPLRKSKPAGGLLPWTLVWLESLPPGVRPLALATRFPRIVNRLAAGWNEPSACRANFEELVYDARGQRQGFPPDVYDDLLTLRDYYYGYSPELALQA